MDGKRVTIVAIVAILIGLLVGYLFWGAASRRQEAELAQARASLAEAQKAAAAQEQSLAQRLQALEAQLKEISDRLAAEKAARTRLEGQVTRGKK
jgi:cell division protein FtsB